MTQGITVQSEGRRHYLIGNTYPIRDQLRSAGANWDSARRVWWTGKRAVAEELAKLEVPERESRNGNGSHGDKLESTSEIVGKATYKGRQYLLVWEGETRRGPAAKLAFRDGSKVFWASVGEYQIVRRYREPITLGKLTQLREEYSQAKRDGLEHPLGKRYECDECGEWVTSGDGSCWETGASH